MPLFLPSGGLLYHARAFRLGKTCWAPFRRAVREWLARWEPPCSGLLLIGPSGGYSLPTEWLARFSEVVAIDFDPLARPLFGRRHRACRSLRWVLEDVLPVGTLGLDSSALERRLAEYPDHAVLFSNVLGQLALSSACEDAVERDLAVLRQTLDGRHWASYHDRLSAPRRPDLPSDRRHRNDLELARLAYSGGGEIVSHSTALLGRGLECETFAWECERGYWNLIEGCVGKGAGRTEHAFREVAQR